MAYKYDGKDETKSAPEDYSKAERIRREVAATTKGRSHETISPQSPKSGQWASKDTKKGA